MTTPSLHAAPPAEAAFRSHHRSGRSRLALAGVGWSLVNTLLGAGLSALVFALASRVLSPDDFGQVALALAIVMFLGCLTPVAFGEALVQQRELGPRHLDTVFWAATGAALVLYAALFAAAPVLAQWFGTPTLEGLLRFIGLRLVIDAAAAVPGAIVLRAMNFRAMAQRTALANAVGGAVCLVLMWAGFGLWALAATQVVTALFALLALLPAARWRPGLAVSRSAWSELFSFGMFSAGTRFLAEMRLDQMLIGSLAGPTALGLYYFARRLFQILGDLTAGAFNPVASVLLASVQDEPEKRRDAFLIACHASALLAVPVFAGLMALSGTAVPAIFGAQWAAAIPALQALSVIGIMASLGVVQAALIRAAGRADWWFGYQAVSQLSALPLIWLAMPLGLAAVMWLLTLRVMLLWPASVRMTLRILELPFAAYLRAVAAPFSAGVLMAGGILTLAPHLSPLGVWAQIGLQIAFGAVLYLGAVLPMSWDQLRQIRSILRNRKARP